MTYLTIGFDNSKSHPDVFRPADRAAQRFANSAAGFRALTKWLGKARLAQVERQIAELDVEIAVRIEAEPTTAFSRNALCSMPGIGTVTAATMPTLMPEIGILERKQAASLAGLAPITRQSGQWQGKAFIGGGRKPLRDALSMPALVAMRFSPDVRTKYEHLRAAGKPPKQPS